MPSLSVVQTDPSRRRKVAPGAFLAAEAQAPIEEPCGKPLEPDRNFEESAPELGRDPVDHAAC